MIGFRFGKILATTALITFITGCIPAALLVGATAGGAVVYDKRTTKTMLQDQQASESVTQMVANTPELQYGTHVVVTTFNHVMLLLGETTTEEQRDRVYQLASSVRNIRRIYNRITIGKPISNSAQAQDGWITTKIKSKMLAQPGFSSTEIKVITEDGVVYLLGVLSPQQAADAVDIARNTDGVKTVVKVFENLE